MASAVGLRADYSAAELRRLAAVTTRTRAAGNRTEAARIGGMDRQTLRDWVHRFQRAWPRGSSGQLVQGPEPRLSNEPRPGVVRWRRIDLQRVILERFGVAYHERTIGKLLKALGFSHSQRPPASPGAGSAHDRGVQKRMARPVGKRLVRGDLTGLRQRIRSRGHAPAKMEFRAPWSS